MFDKKIIIVTPWFERFAGGAELLARGMAREFNKRGLPAMVFTTCSLSPYDSWWEDHYQPGVYDVAGKKTQRISTRKGRGPDAAGHLHRRRRGQHKTPDAPEFFYTVLNSQHC